MSEDNQCGCGMPGGCDITRPVGPDLKTTEAIRGEMILAADRIASHMAALGGPEGAPQMQGAILALRSFAARIPEVQSSALTFQDVPIRGNPVEAPRFSEPRGLDEPYPWESPR